MDQSQLAGIGNIYSDEILFQARLHPRTRVEKLSDKQIDELYRTMRRVLTTAIKKGTGSEVLLEQLPPRYLLRHREAGGRCPRCGGKVQTLEAGGRTAYYCPKCQRQ